MSSAGEQDTFIYPSGTGDPGPSAVLTSCRTTPGGYTSRLSWVNGTLYAGGTSAGGYGVSISLRGGGTPGVVFSAPVTFIPQIRDGEITQVETDAAVTAIVHGGVCVLEVNPPQKVQPR